VDTADTPNYGLTRIGPGETVAKDGFKALDGDRLTLDALLRALEYHTHDASPRLADPPEDTVPVLTASSTGGQLAAGRTYYYSVSLLDRWGLETAVSSEGEVVTPNAIAIDGAPGVTAFATGGTITPGIYAYVYTYVSDSGGETNPSPPATLTVSSGSTNSVVVDIPDLPGAVLYANVFRSKDGQSQFFYCGEHDGLTDYFTDTGDTMDYTTVAPRANTTGNTCSVAISLETWPGGTWDGASGWRLYRSLTPGGYTGSSLVHEVVETEAEDSVILRKTWVDAGDEMQQGSPKYRSSTFSGGALINMGSAQGQLPITAMPRGSQSLTFSGALVGTVFDGTSAFPKIQLPYAIRPVSFQLSAAGVSGRSSGSTVVVALQSSGGATIGDPVQLVLNNNTGLYTASWPMVDDLRLQGEDLARSSSAVLTISDLAASSGSAVVLDGSGEWVDGTFDLDPGVWHLRLRHRFTGTHSATDMHYHFFSGATELVDTAFDGAATVSSTYTTVTPTIAGGGLIWAGGPLRVRIRKSSAAATVHMIDYLEMYTNVPTIPAGQASVVYTPPGSGSMGTFHTYTLWY